MLGKMAYVIDASRMWTVLLCSPVHCAAGHMCAETCLFLLMQHAVCFSDSASRGPFYEVGWHRNTSHFDAYLDGS